MIHSTAIIDSSAHIDDGVTIGAYCVIGSNVTIGKGSCIDSHTVIDSNTILGKDNHIFSYASIGQDPQDKKYKGTDTQLIIGDHNVIREFVTLNRGTEDGGGHTTIGNHNLIMAYVHIAHDCVIGDHNILANTTGLAGHVTIANHTTLGGFTLIHQFCRVGDYAFTGFRSSVRKDVVPYMLTAGGEHTKTYGPNSIGLERKGFSKDTIHLLKQAWRDLIRNPSKYKENKSQYEILAKQHPEIKYLMEFIDSSERGITY